MGCERPVLNSLNANLTKLPYDGDFGHCFGVWCVNVKWNGFAEVDKKAECGANFLIPIINWNTVMFVIEWERDLYYGLIQKLRNAKFLNIYIQQSRDTYMHVRVQISDGCNMLVFKSFALLSF